MRAKKERIFYIQRENRYNKKMVIPVMNRKDFRKLTEDRNYFGKVILGIKPELMNDENYMEFIKSKPEGKLVI